MSSQVKEKKLTNDKASNGRPVQPNSVIPAERELERTSVVVKTLFLGLETKTETWTNELECTEFQDHGLEITTLHVVDTVY